MDAPGSPSLGSPHRQVKTSGRREEFLLRLLDKLWERYRSRVSYVRTYEDVVRRAGGAFVNDHIAFRTLACQKPSAGIFSVSRIFEALGYAPAASYFFPDKRLEATHYQHPTPGFPKLFVSELHTWELSSKGNAVVLKSLRGHRPPLADAVLAACREADKASAPAAAKLLGTLMDHFSELPWPMPQKSDVVALNEESQYAAWVLVRGYDVNHFTASVNSHGVESLGDIEKTVGALRHAGVPMKTAIEGERGSKLRQSATEAVVTDVSVKQGSKTVKMPWPYAYCEIAERGMSVDPDTGTAKRFEGFLGGQASQLFEMTRRK